MTHTENQRRAAYSAVGAALRTARNAFDAHLDSPTCTYESSQKHYAILQRAERQFERSLTRVANKFSE